MYVPARNVLTVFVFHHASSSSTCARSFAMDAQLSCGAQCVHGILFLIRVPLPPSPGQITGCLSLHLIVLGGRGIGGGPAALTCQKHRIEPATKHISACLHVFLHISMTNTTSLQDSIKGC